VQKWTYRIIPRDGSNEGSSCFTLLKLSPFIKHTKRNKSRAYTDPILRNGLSLLTDPQWGKLKINQHLQQTSHTRMLWKTSNTQGYCKAISKSLTCTNISHRYIQIRVAERRGYLMRNASLGDFALVRTSKSVLTPT